MKKNGKLKDGIRQRRDSGSGTLMLVKGIYYARFRMRDEITGKTFRKVYSTHTGDLATARTTLDDLARKLGFTAKDQSATLLEAAHNAQHERERQERERIERETAEAVAKAKAEAEERAKAEAEERDSNAITLASAFTYYRASKKRPDSGERTLAGYETQYGIFAAWMRQHYPKIEKMRDFTPDMAECFLDHLEKTRSRSTRNKYLVFLRTMWRVLRWEADAQLTVDPWDGIRTLVQTDTVKHKDLTVDELRRVIEVIRNGQPLAAPKREGSAAGGIKDVFTFNGESIRAELLLLFAVAVYTGLRLGDCALLTWGQVDLAMGVVKVTPAKTKRRWNAAITIPIHAALGQLLVAVATAQGGTGYLMPTLADIYANRQPSMLTNRIQTIFRAAGLETSADAPEGGERARVQIGFHSLRHFFASWLDNHGTNHALTNYLVSHSQGTVEARYFHENREALQRAISTLPMLPLTDDAPTLTEAATAAPQIVDAQFTMQTANAPKGIVEAIRAIVVSATDGELQEAVKVIEGEIERRSATR